MSLDQKNAFDPKMLEALICPLSHGQLEYQPDTQELFSKSANLAFPIRNGIPILIEDEARLIK
jgi:uncharacterized protein YbaR (Trm112 family)